MLKVYYKGDLIGEVDTPEGIGVLYPEYGINSKYLTLDESDELAYYQDVALKKIIAYREQASKTMNIKPSGDGTYTISLSTDSLLKLEIRKQAGTDGFWYDVNMRPFLLTGAQFQTLEAKLIEYGDFLYGRMYTYSQQIKAATNIDEVENIIAAADAEFAEVSKDVKDV